MGCKINGKLITLPGNYRWTYYTSGKLDIDEPQFMEAGDSIFKVQFATTSQQDYTAPEASDENKTPHQIAADNILGFTEMSDFRFSDYWFQCSYSKISGQR